MRFFLNSLVITVLLVVSCTNKNDGNIKHKNSKSSEMKNEEQGIAFPKVFELAFTENYIVDIVNTTIIFNKIEIGQLNVSSGKIIACDPLVVHDAIPFKHQFPIGKFPVQLAISKINNDERVGFSRILFSENKVKKWEFALLPGQEKISLTEESVYGYGVDTSLGLFTDVEARDKYCKFYLSTWEDVFVTKMRVNFRNTWSYLLYEFDNTNLVTFYTGFGDGSYSTYIGLDENGEICQLLTDFDLVDWWMP